MSQSQAESNSGIKSLSQETMYLNCYNRIKDSLREGMKQSKLWEMNDL
jgi:hypothetical protein